MAAQVKTHSSAAAIKRPPLQAVPSLAKGIHIELEQLAPFVAEPASGKQDEAGSIATQIQHHALRVLSFSPKTAQVNMEALLPKKGLSPAFLVDPASLHILLVDASSTSRQHITSLLRDCSYQVTACKTSQEAIQILKAQQGPEGTAGFDLIMKEHSPTAGTNACRLLRRAQTESVLQGLPIVVASTTEERDVMVSCLQLGAADYMLKPLRHNELRNLWARVYWWRRASYLQDQPAGSVSLPATSGLLEGSGGSDETKCCSMDDEPQESIIGENPSGKGSAPNGNNQNGSGKINGSGGEGSKNGSKEGLGWSRSQAKPKVGNSGDANGNSATKAEQGSNQPSDEAGQAQETSKSAKGNSWMGHNNVSRDPPAQISTADILCTVPDAGNTELDIAPLKVASKPNSDMCEVAKRTGLTPVARGPTSEPLELQSTGILAQSRPLANPPGFRAYVAKDNPRKRPAEAAQKEHGGRSSGSDRTTSMEQLEGVKRQSMTRLGSVQPPVSESAGSDATFARFSSGAVTSEAGQGPVGAGRTLPRGFGDMPGACGSGSWSPLQPGQQNASNFNTYYPYGVMPSPFAMAPQFWGQLSGGGTCREADLSSFFPYSQQGQGKQGAEVQQGLQQQQMAMHNQLMFQHSILMQQYGMPAPPFATFPGFNPNQQQARGSQGQTQQQGLHAVAAQTAGQSSAQTAKQATANRSTPPKDSVIGDQLTRRNTSSTWTPSFACEQSFPASGLGTGAATATGAANGNTLGHNGNVNGATSHATAQVGPDGCMVEPSRQERRAQALRKYKQKRKNLCFTKKIRYESRKQLAQARPRVKGQFVRMRSDDVQEVADALKAQKDAGSSGDAVVPQILMEKANGNADVAAELMEAARNLAGPGGMDNTEEDDFEEELEDGEDDDVSSPAQQNGPAGAEKAISSIGSLLQFAQTCNPGGAVAALAGNKASRHTSDSGSNLADVLVASAKA